MFIHRIDNRFYRVSEDGTFPPLPNYKIVVSDFDYDADGECSLVGYRWHEGQAYSATDEPTNIPAYPCECIVVGMEIVWSKPVVPAPTFLSICQIVIEHYYRYAEVADHKEEIKDLIRQLILREYGGTPSKDARQAMRRVGLFDWDDCPHRNIKPGEIVVVSDKLA